MLGLIKKFGMAAYAKGTDFTVFVSFKANHDFFEFAHHHIWTKRANILILMAFIR